ncbi:histidine phosphatase family protein, partial [Candidatus Gracilibacteria bacterium]|nr:histidine phosphatase family protein [Candidatus Gracilibacteria bacterium]
MVGQTPKYSSSGRKTLLFARHGESEANVEKVIGGDYPLTEKGKKTAEDIFNHVKDRKITKIICSDLKRGKETAEIVSRLFANNVQVEIWPELNEFFSLELAEKAGDDLKREGPIQFNFDQIQDEKLEGVRA